MELSGKEKVWLLEQMNLLVTDPELSAVRSRAAVWVTDRLKQELLNQIQAVCEITPDQWNSFTAGQEPDFSQTQAKIYENFPFSRAEKQEMKILARTDKTAVAQRMLTYLLKKARTAFQKQAGITATAWSGFLNCSRYTQDGVLDQIISGLGLCSQEAAEFRALAFRDTFSVDQDLKDHVRDLILDKNPSLSAFLLDSQLSENAWEPFRTNPKNLPTSQATFLKIILGLRSNQAEGRDLLHRVNSDFVMRRDLAVLICIRTKIFDIHTIYYILEFFAEGYGGERYFRNLYSDPESV